MKIDNDDKMVQEFLAIEHERQKEDRSKKIETDLRFNNLRYYFHHQENVPCWKKNPKSKMLSPA